ncbi:unnamed protein product [Arabis nemorensis]|uniref:Uncharacterized protein n=1 Tax=Arabis nemorensis TaxID=586526 RepID=A0A565CFM8_9BRAS|nr:unnamed protein product [Arabis nemorensis]
MLKQNLELCQLQRNAFYCNVLGSTGQGLGMVIQLISTGSSTLEELQTKSITLSNLRGREWRSLMRLKLTVWITSRISWAVLLTQFQRSKQNR